MPSNSSAMHMGWLAGRFERRIGWLLPAGEWRKPHHWLPYALDNGAFGAWINERPWDEAAFVELCERARQHPTPPLWGVVPDVVTDREATIASWHKWEPIMREKYRWPLAFAVQDGMTPDDVPKSADVVFVGGSTDWKWKTVLIWCRNFPRVHVGRVNGYRRLWDCHDAGAESCDGTGWMRGDQEQLAGLERYLSESTSGGRIQQRLVA